VALGSIPPATETVGLRSATYPLAVQRLRPPGTGRISYTLAGRVRFAWLDDTGLVGKDHRLDPVAQAELGEQVAHV
jgi:hypothetical protein